MNIAPNTVATIHYTLTDGGGNLIESSQGGEPLAYIHGIGAIMPGLEAALEGKTAGDTLRVTLPPEAAYGERDEALVQALSRGMFSEPDDLEVGMRFRAQSEAGAQIFTIIGLDDGDCGRQPSTGGCDAELRRGCAGGARRDSRRARARPCPRPGRPRTLNRTRDG